MKGISTILAMILIVIIVVALIGLTYTFAVGLFTTTTGGATEQTSQITEQMQKSVYIVAARCNGTSNNLNFNFTLKNTGTQNIVQNDLKVFVDDSVQTFYLSPATLTKGSTSDQINMTVTNPALVSNKEFTLKVSAPAADVEKKVTCV